MRICIIGCGFVGLTTGVTLAHLGHKVWLVEIEKKRLLLLKAGKTPFLEPGLQEMFSDNLRKKRITIGNDTKKAVEASDFIFIAVQTPISTNGEPNLDYLKSSAEAIGKALCKNKMVIVKSTVPPGTTRNILIPVMEKVAILKAGKDFGVAVNPEFLQEGRAIQDSLNPSRIIVGAINNRSAKAVLNLFMKIKAKTLVTDVTTAEMIKLVSNCFLATKITFANEIANFCEKTGTDINNVMKGVGMDPRIGDKFMKAGLGFGGSCLPKDLAAMITSVFSAGNNPILLKAVKEVNDKQPLRAIDLLNEEVGRLRGKRIAILGLAFKAGVDDIRDTRALSIANKLIESGADVVAYDPLAMDAFKSLLPNIDYAFSASEALADADACILQTEENEFSSLTRKDFSRMRNRIVIDGRRILAPESAKRLDIRLRAIGLPSRPDFNASQGRE